MTSKGPGVRHGLTLRIYLMALLPIILTALVLGVLDFLAAGRPASGPPLGRYLISTVAANRGDARALSEIKAQLEQQTEAKIAVYDSSGSLLASNVSPAPAPLSDVQVRRLEHFGAFAFGEPPRFAQGVNEGEQLVAYGVFWGTEAAIDVRYLLLPIGLILFFLTITAVYFARSLAKPIAHLRDTAAAFGAGDLEARAGLDRKDELGALSRRFDEMADRITKLLQSQKQLLANVSHELRTPLARIRVALDIADLDEDEDQADSPLAGIAEDLTELERLVSDIMATARLDLEAGRASKASFPIHLEQVPAASVLEAAVASFRQQRPPRQLEVCLDDDLPMINADPVLLRRVVDNLLSNARKYSEDDSVVTLSASRDKGSLLVEVVDRGMGIDRDDLEKIFTPFFRVDESRTRATGGVGLGLSLARQIVESHRGTMTIESEKDSGTSVRFTIPASE